MCCGSKNKLYIRCVFKYMYGILKTQSKSAAGRAYPDVRGVDVPRVVLLGGHQLHPGAVVRQDVLEAVLVRALGLLGHGALSRRVPPRDALVLLQQLPPLQVLLQQLALQTAKTGLSAAPRATTLSRSEAAFGPQAEPIQVGFPLKADFQGSDVRTVHTASVLMPLEMERRFSIRFFTKKK